MTSVEQDREYNYRLLKDRAARLARLAEHKASIMFLANEIALIDMSLARIMNVEAEFSDLDKDRQTYVDLLGDLRKTWDKGFMFNEEAALELMTLFVSRKTNTAVIAHCEQNKCKWLDDLENEVDNIVKDDTR